jgi:hypothetical protein
VSHKKECKTAPALKAERVPCGFTTEALAGALQSRSETSLWPITYHALLACDLRQWTCGPPVCERHYWSGGPKHSFRPVMRGRRIGGGMNDKNEWSLRAQVEKWLGPNSGQRNRVIQSPASRRPRGGMCRLRLRAGASYVPCFSFGTVTAAGMYSLHRTKGPGWCRSVSRPEARKRRQCATRGLHMARSRC